MNKGSYLIPGLGNTIQAVNNANMPLPAIIGAGVGALGQVASGLIGQRKNYKYQKKLATHAFNQNVQMWNMQNEYNSPAAQMQRLKDAGLNPNMIYGQSAAGATGNAGSMPTYQKPNANMSYNPVSVLPEMISRYQDFELKQAQIDNVKAKNQNQTIRNIMLGTQNEFLRENLTAKLSGYQADWENKRTRNILLSQAAEVGAYKMPYERDYWYAMQPHSADMARAYKDYQIARTLEKGNQAYWSQFGPAAGIVLGTLASAIGNFLPVGRIGKAAKMIPGKSLARPGMSGNKMFDKKVLEHGRSLLRRTRYGN